MPLRPSIPFLSRSQLAALGALVLLAFCLAVLPTCAFHRGIRLIQPIEFFLLADGESPKNPVPYTDPSGAITGFLAEKPGLILERVEDISVETHWMPVLQQGRVVGKEPHRFARIALSKRDRKRLETFTAAAVGSVMLIRVNRRLVFPTFLTQALSGEEFVVSGPDTEETREAIQAIQATLPAGSRGFWDK